MWACGPGNPQQVRWVACKGLGGAGHMAWFGATRTWPKMAFLFAIVSTQLITHYIDWLVQEEGTHQQQWWC